jgi:hypothetical protein
MPEQDIEKFGGTPISEQLMSVEQKKRINELIGEGKIAIDVAKLSAMTAEQAQDIINRFDALPKKPSKEPKVSTQDTQTAKKEEYVDEQERQHLATMQFDLLDEGQIVEMLEGRSNKKYIYAFQVGGKTIEGISYAGTIDAARFYSERTGSPLEVVDYTLLETPDAYRCFVRVRDGKSGIVLPGYSAQPKKMKVYTNRDRTEFVMKDDEKADVKAVSKATRNGFRNVMPANYIDAYIETVKKGVRK